jgi:hypothetical protein
MKYTIDLDTNSGFVQIFGIAEYGRMADRPVAFQVRGRIGLLKNMQKLLVRVVERICETDETYHDSVEAKNDFTYGFVEFVPGDIPLTAIVQMRMTTLVIGSRKFGEDEINTQALLDAVNQAIAQFENE